MATYNEVLAIINANLASGSNISASSHRLVEETLLDFAESQWLTGDVKEVDCTAEYILANFESNGLGINERVGWAICNGQNGTKNRSGRVSVAYGTGYTTMGATGGFSTHTLQSSEIPAHYHFGMYGAQLGSLDSYGSLNHVAASARSGTNSSNYGMAGTNSTPNVARTSTTGSGGAHNNMQPYIVTLFIQKI